eukprot:g38910.t1
MVTERTDSVKYASTLIPLNWVRENKMRIMAPNTVPVFLTSSQYRRADDTVLQERLRGDLIEVFKIMSRLDRVDGEKFMGTCEVRVRHQSPKLNVCMSIGIGRILVCLHDHAAEQIVGNTGLNIRTYIRTRKLGTSI